MATEGHVSSPKVEWLEHSYREPGAFFLRLGEAHRRQAVTAPKSAIGEGYDLYHDAVLCHVKSIQPALRWYDSVHGWRELGYRELHGHVSQRAATWLAAGFEAGQTVALLDAPGAEQIVDLLTAMRVGAVVSVLPVRGKAFLARRLDELSPDHIACDPLIGRVYQELGPLILPRMPGSAAADSAMSATYDSGAVFARLFSPLADPCHVPIELTVDQAYCHALRDGLLTFGLTPGAALAYPGADPLQTQPALLLATLLVGGTYVHIDLEDLERDPTVLQTHPLQALGVSRPLREILDRTPVDLGPKRCAFWFKSPADAGDLLEWQATAEQCGFADTPCANVLIDAASGGALLTSLRRSRFMTLMVRPAAGMAWQLVNVMGQGRPAYGPFGLFVPAGADTEGLPWGGILISAWRNDWNYIGTREPRRRGHVYPREEVLACLTGLPFVEGASIVLVSTGDSSAPHKFGLCVFVGPNRRQALEQREDAWEREIRTRIFGERGPTYVPDPIEFFPLCARRTDSGEVDHRHAQTLHASGALHRRAGRETHLLFARLQQSLSGAPTGSAPDPDLEVR
ncbi:MAG: hypothetical protein ACYS22_10695 [Planctomycetota bacterium]|jgi:hypothetical protein